MTHVDPIGREKNYYEVLGFSNTHVSLEELTKQYQTLNEKYNPSFNTDPENLTKFKKIQEAYDCLNQVNCRLQYKKFGSYI